MPVRSEAEVIQWLDASPNRERSGDFRGLRLEAMHAVLAKLPPPPPPLTIAGTKGKGSTLRLCEMALVAAGIKTCVFTSPHVTTVRERWRLDGVPVRVDELISAVPPVDAAEQCAGVRLSWFERTLAIAVVLAVRRPHQRFLCEVGIGGRCDAVNAIAPAVAVITQLSFDHRDVLGPTLEHIAQEKLGIARCGRPLIIAPQSTAATLALLRRMPAGVQPRWAVAGAERLALRGAHQRDNAAAARLALSAFAPAVDPAPGFAQANLAGRCQVLDWAGRQLLIDGAHNGASVAATMAVAEQVLTAPFTVILAVANDKEIAAIAAALPLSARLVRCGYASPRARGRDDWPQSMCTSPWYADVATALAATTGPTCITGSLYAAGEALQVVGQAGVWPG